MSNVKKMSALTIAELEIESKFPDKLSAFTPAVYKNGTGLGIAVANEPGYVQLSLNHCRFETWDDAQKEADRLNKVVFKIGTETAFEVVLSSMQQGRVTK